MSGLGNVGKQFAVDIINDFFNVKISMCDIVSKNLSWYGTGNWTFRTSSVRPQDVSPQDISPLNAVG